MDAREVLRDYLACSDHTAPPSRSRLAPAADALTGPFAQKWRLADQTRSGLGIGVVPPGFGLLVVVDHRYFSPKSKRLRKRLPVRCGGL